MGLGMVVSWFHTPHSKTNTITAKSENFNFSTPQLLNIPSLNINADFVPLALNPDKTLEVPQDPEKVGWFIYATNPGEIGPAVVVGHLDSVSGPAVFANLSKINPGDKVNITRSDGLTIQFQVDYKATFSQNNFPTQAVYGPVNFAGLRLITCTGTYQKNLKHYSSNLVVFAHRINS